jgi:hypothetical protein
MQLDMPPHVEKALRTLSTTYLRSLEVFAARSKEACIPVLFTRMKCVLHVNSYQADSPSRAVDLEGGSRARCARGGVDPLEHMCTVVTGYNK